MGSQTVEKAKKLTPTGQNQSSRVTASGVGTAFFVALMIFALLNQLTAAFTENQKKREISEVLAQAAAEKSENKSSNHTWGWWLARLYQEQKAAPDLVIFGSSLFGSAHASIDATMNQKLIDVVTHRRVDYFEYQLKERLSRKLSVFSLACPGEMISDAYMLTKALFVPGLSPKVVIATIAPRDFVDSTLPYPAATEQFKFLSNYVDNTSMLSCAYPEFFSRFGAEIDRLAIKKYGKSLIQTQAEACGNDLDGLTFLRVEPGKAMVPANAVPAWSDNTREYAERFRNPVNANYKAELQFFKAWLSDLRAKGIDVMVVCMPTMEANRKLLPDSFWTEFKTEVSKSCKENQAEWFDLSDSGLFQKQDYLDTVHLSSYGAAKLFPVLAEKITLLPKLKERLGK